MTTEQLSNEILYRASVRFIKKLLEKGMLTKEQFNAVNRRNAKDFGCQIIMV